MDRGSPEIFTRGLVRKQDGFNAKFLTILIFSNGFYAVLLTIAGFEGR